jgi:hypothetical protein
MYGFPQHFFSHQRIGKLSSCGELVNLGGGEAYGSVRG